MNIDEAEIIIQRYGEVLSIPLSKGHIARRASLLPAKPETIIKAFKVCLIYIFSNNTVNNVVVNNYLVAVSGLGSFVEDGESERINLATINIRNGNSNLTDREKDLFQNFTKQMDNRRARESLNNLALELDRLAPDDPDYFEKAFKLAGINREEDAAHFVFNKVINDNVEESVKQVALHKNLKNHIPNILFTVVIAIIIGVTGHYFVTAGKILFWVFVVLLAFEALRFILSVFTGFVLLFSKVESKKEKAASWKTNAILAAGVAIDVFIVWYLYELLFFK